MGQIHGVFGAPSRFWSSFSSFIGRTRAKQPRSGNTALTDVRISFLDPAADPWESVAGVGAVVRVSEWESERDG